MYFDSLFDLITHYQSHPLRSSKFSITLGKPAPPTNPHEDRPWFHAQLSRSLAEDVLSSIPVDGAFLVRQGERVSGRGKYSSRNFQNLYKKNVLKKLILVYKISKRLLTLGPIFHSCPEITYTVRIPEFLNYPMPFFLTR